VLSEIAGAGGPMMIWVAGGPGMPISNSSTVPVPRISVVKPDAPKVRVVTRTMATLAGSVVTVVSVVGVVNPPEETLEGRLIAGTVTTAERLSEIMLEGRLDSNPEGRLVTGVVGMSEETKEKLFDNNEGDSETPEGITEGTPEEVPGGMIITTPVLAELDGSTVDAEEVDAEAVDSDEADAGTVDAEAEDVLSGALVDEEVPIEEVRLVVTELDAEEVADVVAVTTLLVVHIGCRA